MTDVRCDELSRCNRAFYEAFEARDLDAMSDLWEHSDRVSCTHPGWSVLRGWGAVAASWLAMFQGPQQIQFILTDEHVEVVGDLGWVTRRREHHRRPDRIDGERAQRVRARRATAGGSWPTTARRRQLTLEPSVS